MNHHQQTAEKEEWKQEKKCQILERKTFSFVHRQDMDRDATDITAGIIIQEPLSEEDSGMSNTITKESGKIDR